MINSILFAVRSKFFDFGVAPRYVRKTIRNAGVDCATPSKAGDIPCCFLFRGVQ